MIRIAVLFLAAGLAALPAFALEENDGVVSLFDDMPEVKKAASSDKASAAEDDNGIFSFLNIGGPKKAPLPTTDKQGRENEVLQAIALAEKGNLEAQLALGYLYLYGGEGIEVDREKAFKYYSMAALQNDPTALNNLGSLYYSGIGVSRDRMKAAKLFEQAVKLDNTEAALNLGFMYITGNGVARNDHAAMDLFTKAAQAGNPTGQFMLGYAYYKGFIVPQDYKRAAELLRAAADKKFDEAEYIMAQLYLNGQGITQNYGQAVRLLNRAADQGNTAAMMLLAGILSEGEKYAKDWRTAHILYNIAAVNGIPAAAARREELASKLKIEQLLDAQAAAERFKAKPSELTDYVHKTFGNPIYGYIDGTNQLQ